VKDLLSLLGFYDIVPELKRIGAKLIDFKNYSVVMWVALALCFALLVFGIVLVCKEDYRKQGILSLICAVVNAPFLIVSIGIGYGKLSLLAVVVLAILFIVVQLVSDYEVFSTHCFVCGELAVVCAIIAAFFVPETNDESVIIGTMLGQSLTVALFITNIVAIVHTSDGFLYSDKKTLYSSSYYSSSGGYSSENSSSSSGYQNIHDARTELKYKLDSRYLSPSEKQALIKEHNDKYFDAVNYDNGVYSNVYER